MNEARRTPIRSCFGCRTRGPKSGLLRLMSGDGELRVGWRGERRTEGAPETGGRGRWVCPRRRCVDIASRKLRRGRTTPGEISELRAGARAQAERRMRRRAAGLRRRRLEASADTQLMALQAIIDGIDAQRA